MFSLLHNSQVNLVFDREQTAEDYLLPINQGNFSDMLPKVDQNLSCHNLSYDGRYEVRFGWSGDDIICLINEELTEPKS